MTWTDPASGLEVRCVMEATCVMRNEKARLLMRRAFGSAPRRTRTYNPLIKSQLLCQLS